MLRFLIVAAACVSTLIPAIIATQGIAHCAGDLPQVIEAIVHGCDAVPCTIQIGGFAAMDITVHADERVERFHPEATAFLGGIIPVPYPLSPDVVNAACYNLDGAECPIEQGTTFVYNFQLDVGPNYPQTPNIHVQINLLNSHTNSSIGCTRVIINAQH